MGVKHLWPILTPFCERKPLFELQGQTIAIDLSCWIVDTQTATEYVVQPKMYLRNLYFRTANLLLQDIRPVFVLEGKAPELKQKTIDRRNDIQQEKRTGVVAARKNASKSGRTRFNHVLKECEEMLGYMGLKCVQGYGEAEAMCAYLNADGMVDGCVSQDNDCFLYGARVVYRNFNLSGAAASAGSIDVYRMERTEAALNLDRNRMVALALLCGCDYDDGLNGVGKEAAMKLFQHVGKEDILDRLRSWKTDKKFDRLENEMTNSKGICTSCGHKGNLRLHNKSGCIDCNTKKNCSDDYKERRKLIMNEITLRKKAIVIDSFPNEEIIDEYLNRKGPVPSSLDLKWQQPNIVKFIFFMEKKLGWEAEYSFEKFLPLMTRWQLISLPEISLRLSVGVGTYSAELPVKRLVYPDRIKKIRNIKSVASYEIDWIDSEGFLEGLVSLTEPKSSGDEENSEKIDGDLPNPALVTIEPQNLVLKCYPELVAKFDEEKAMKKKAKNPRAKVKPKENVEKAKKRERKKVNTRKIDEFVTKNIAESLEDSFGRMEITPKRLKCAPQIERIKIAEGNAAKMNNTLDRMFEDLTADDFASENEGDFNMSEIIDEICSRRRSKERRFPLTEVNEAENSGKKNVLVVESTINEQRTNSGCIETEVREPEAIVDGDTAKIDSLNETDEFADIENYVPLSQRVNSIS